MRKISMSREGRKKKIRVLVGILSLCGIAPLLSACDDESSSVLKKMDAAASGSTDAAANDASLIGDAQQSDTRQDGGPLDAGKGDITGNTDAAQGDAGLAITEVVGFYSGDWGDMVLKEVNGEIWGAYTHDTGTIVGTFSNGVLAGWWSEVPSRLPPNDAGEVEFRFTRRNGEVFIDGRWKYGAAEAWRENWDIGLVKTTPPPALVARFADSTVFKRHP